jgi:hypothetical protein
VADHQDNIEVAIETKWLSSSRTLIRDIIRDMVRLELLAHHLGAKSYLVLAGSTKRRYELFSQQRFQGHPHHLGSKPILPYDRSEVGSLRFNPPASFRVALLTSALEVFKGVQLINSIRATKFGPDDTESETKQYTACAWRIEARQWTERFLPEDVFDFG